MKAALTSPSFHLKRYPILSITLTYRLTLALFLYVTRFFNLAYDPQYLGRFGLAALRWTRPTLSNTPPAIFLASRLTWLTVLGSLLIVAGIVLLSLCTPN